MSSSLCRGYVFLTFINYNLYEEGGPAPCIEGGELAPDMNRRKKVSDVLPFSPLFVEIVTLRPFGNHSVH